MRSSTVSKRKYGIDIDRDLCLTSHCETNPTSVQVEPAAYYSLN